MLITLNYLVNCLRGFGVVGCLKNNDLYLIFNSENVVNVLKFLKLNLMCQFKQLLDIICIDYLQRKCRFEVVYVLLSVCFSKRIFIKISTANILISVSNIFLSAGWLEREVWDMFGIFFLGHLDLRRILTDYGFIGFPLRKDFPLSGYKEIRYNDLFKKIIDEPIESTQEYRLFDFVNPWEWTYYGTQQ